MDASLFGIIYVASPFDLFGIFPFHLGTRPLGKNVPSICSKLWHSLLVNLYLVMPKAGSRVLLIFDIGCSCFHLLVVLPSWVVNEFLQHGERMATILLYWLQLLFTLCFHSSITIRARSTYLKDYQALQAQLSFLSAVFQLQSVKKQLRFKLFFFQSNCGLNFKS